MERQDLEVVKQENQRELDRKLAELEEYRQKRSKAQICNAKLDSELLEIKLQL